MSFVKKISPSGAFNDIVAIFRDEQQHKWLFFMAAAIPPALLILALYFDSERLSKRPPPEIFYFESWSAERSYDEVLAERPARKALRDAFEEEKRQNFKALGRASGIDVDKIERDTAAAREQLAKERDDLEKRLVRDAQARKQKLDQSANSQQTEAEQPAASQ